jgi:hypothetical protein
MSTHDQVHSHERHRRDRQIEELVHDPYKVRYKPREPSVCPTCGVVYEHGVWHWKGRPEGAHEHICPACQRTKDKLPAGYVTLEGEFLAPHRDEIMQLVRNEEARAKAEHPMERILAIQQEGGKTVVTTTDVHVARRIGDALRHAYQGALEIKYSPDEYLVRVFWSRS